MQTVLHKFPVISFFLELKNAIFFTSNREQVGSRLKEHFLTVELATIAYIVWFCFFFPCHHHLAECFSPTNNFSLFHAEFWQSFAHLHYQVSLFFTLIRATDFALCTWPHSCTIILAPPDHWTERTQKWPINQSVISVLLCLWINSHVHWPRIHEENRFQERKSDQICNLLSPVPVLVIYCLFSE